MAIAICHLLPALPVELDIQPPCRKFLTLSLFLAILKLANLPEPGELVPTVLRKESYRFFLTLGDCHEPPHIHVQEGNRKAKFWLDPIAVAREGRFRSHEMRGIERIIGDYQQYLLQEWRKLCGD
jgi:hypothetical protein